MHRIIVAKHFTGIFVQKSINPGLQTVICPDIEADKGDELGPFANKLVNKTSGMTFTVVPLPETRQAIINAGGIIPFTRQRL